MADSREEAGSFLGKAGPLVLARLFTAALSAVIPLALARALPLEEYGTYKQLWMIAQTLYYVLAFGMPQSLYFFVPRTAERRPLFFQTLAYLLVAGAVVCLVLVLGAGTVGHLFSNPGIVQHRLPLGIYAGALLASHPLEISLTSQGRTKQSALAYLASDFLRVLAMTVPVLLGHGLTGMMAAMAAFALLRLVAAWWVALAGSRGPFWSWASFRKQWAWAAPFGLAMALAIPQQYAHQYAVSALVPPAAFALYAVGCFQLPLVDLLYTPTSEVLMVRIGELEKAGRVQEALAVFRHATSRLAFAFVPLSVFFFVAAPEFISLAFGDKFLGAVPVFRVSVLGVLLAMAPLDGVLRARNHTRQILVSYGVKALVTLPLVYFGVRRFGVMGGIGSWAIAECVGKLTLLVKVPAALGLEGRSGSWRAVLPWRSLGQAAAGAATGVAAVLAGRLVVASWPAPAWMHGVLWKTVPFGMATASFGMAYLAVLWALGVRPRLPEWVRATLAPKALPRSAAAP